MLLKVINPNTTASMTATIERSARAVAGPGTRLEVVSNPMGPASIESHYDEALSVPGLLAEIQAGERAGVAGYVVACFGDPGLDAARELATAPVLGIAQAAMHAASMLGRGFSVVTTLGRTVGRAHDLALSYGFERVCLGVHACEIPVLELETDPDAFATIVESCRAAMLSDGCDAIVLGCAGMADLCARISDAVGVPVVDGVSAAVVMVEALARMGLRGASTGEFARPPGKPYTGLLSGFELPGDPVRF
ncbi:aspartate/glutamate racemase family protein [Spongisporangium articulatum]|uniref:Aspartate/glutamate racemase family protein n=1 Tax=Spongisporangium articulatum TaxID=3362603 RepID=A0ABW8AT21_9ACTN